MSWSKVIRKADCEDPKQKYIKKMNVILGSFTRNILSITREESDH